MKKVRLGSGSAYWGDALDPAIELLEKGDVEYVGFDHLAELTMSILHKQKEKDPTKGYVDDIIPFMKALLPISHKKGIKLITNAGGANPLAAAQEVVKIAKSLGFQIKVGVVYGDDVTDKIEYFREKGIKLTNLDTGEEDVDRISDRIVSAYAYIGAEGIVECLRQGAEVVVCGRVSDNALYIGPLMYEFGWDYDDINIDKLGAAVTIGHVIECSCCVTGGMSNMWQQVPNPWRLGYPIAEVYENGDAIITKAEDTGGLVNQWTVKEHLLYEVHDPSNYIMPDGIADFSSLHLEEIGRDQVKLTNMKGKPRPKDLKVCIGYEDGWIGEGVLLFPWPNAYERAKKGAEILLNRLKLRVNLEADEIQLDYIGINTLHGEASPEPEYDLNEVGLRIAVRTRTREEADKVRREATHLWTMGPVGTAFGVPYKPRKVVSLWPTLVPREEFPTKTMILEA